MRLSLFFSLFGSFMHLTAQGEMFSEMKDDRILIQSKTLPGAAFNLPSMEGIARRFIESAGATRVVSRLLIYSTEDVAFAERGVLSEGNYLQWRARYDGFPKGELMAADVISVGEDALLRLRSRDGATAQQVLRGKDPTKIQVGGILFEIIFVAGRVRSRFEGCGVPGTVDPVLFLKTKAKLSPDICERVTSWLTARLGVNNLWIHIRNDDWFLCTQFPVVFPFSSVETAPSESTYYGSPEYSCSNSCDGAVRCIGPALSRPSRRP